MIDERELAFSREKPLLAWRLFRVRRVTDDYLLCSPMIHSPAPPPWEPGLALAYCFDYDHPAPARRCRCGIYGAIEGTLDSLPGYLLDTSYDGDPYAYAEIACSGRVFLDARGVRSEEALLVQIALAEDSFAIRDDCARARDVLAARYCVPTHFSEAVPVWLTESVRQQGPPESAHSVDLSALMQMLISQATSGR